MRVIDQAQAQAYFDLLPDEFKVASLSPDYVAMDALRDSALIPEFLVYSPQGKEFVLHSLLKGVVPNTDFKDYQSPYNYGGPLTNAIQDNDFLEAAADAYEEFCADHGILAELVKLHPCVPHPFFGENHYNRQTVYLPKEGSKYTATCQQKIRKAEKEGLEVCIARQTSILNFATSYYECMDRLEASKFYYFNEAYFEALQALPSARLYVCELDHEWHAAAIFLEGTTFFEYHLGITNDKGRKTGATNLLLDIAYGIARQKGKGLYLGGGKTTMATDPLLEFKESFGGLRKRFFVGSQVFKKDAYFTLLDDHHEVGRLTPKTLFWR